MSEQNAMDKLLQRSMMSRTTTRKPDKIVKGWLLKGLVDLRGHRQFIEKSGFNSDRLAEALGLDDTVLDEDWFEIDSEKARQQLLRLYKREIAALSQAPLPQTLRKNLAQLAKTIGLSRAAQQILGFAILLKNDPLLDDLSDCLGELSTSQLFRTLSILLNLSEKTVQDTLSDRGLLASSGLLQVDRQGNDYLNGKLNLLSSSFADRMLTSQTSPLALLRDVVSKAPAPTLTLSDYPHVLEPVTLSLYYLREVLKSDKPGVNVLIYGPPGTGKTQLARVLATALNIELFEVALENDENTPITGMERLWALQAAQMFFAERPSLLLFDEAEDVFNDDLPMFGVRSSTTRHKGWMNRMLETNPVPTIWISNQVETLDPAAARRFDQILQLPVPPKSQREVILRTVAQDLLEPDQMRHLAELEHLAPAVLQRAVDVVSTVKNELCQTRHGPMVEHMVSEVLKVQGLPAPRRRSYQPLAENYDPQLIETDLDPESVLNGLRRTGEGRLCFYGPPGTGKTALSHWLAEQLDKPLLIRRASDLLSPYVGASEQQLAACFAQAEQESAVLLIDEVDSFLQDRSQAQRSWEITQVNELLSQMEHFSGIFIASTNLMDTLDSAALRRFDIKMRFNALRPQQAEILFTRICAALGLASPDRQALDRLRQLTPLTPGDFTTVARRHRLQPVANAMQLLEALAAECALKENSPRRIGFV